MSRRLFFFSAWCAFLMLGTILAAYYAWSPFADDDPRNPNAVGGPRHK